MPPKIGLVIPPNYGDQIKAFPHSPPPPSARNWNHDRRRGRSNKQMGEIPSRSHPQTLARHGQPHEHRAGLTASAGNGYHALHH